MNKPEFQTIFTKECPICETGETDFLIRKYDDRFGQPDLFDFYFCKKCNLAFIVNKIQIADMSRLYEKYYASESSVINRLKPLRKIIKKIGIAEFFVDKLAGNLILVKKVNNASKILEIGSGFNDSLKRIIAKKRLKWTGLEVNQECVKKIEAAGLKGYYGTIDNNNIHEKFDIVLLSQALEHQYDISSFFENCKKLLNSKGRIIFTVPNFDSRYRNMYKERWIGWHAPYHTVLLSRKSIENVCRKHGFKIEKFYTLTPTSWYFLQKNFRLPELGKKNNTFKFSFSLFTQFFTSISLRIGEIFNKSDGDCIYCEIKLVE